MTVYIEYVLIDNFFIDYILLESAFALLHKKEKRRRLFLCAFISAIFSLVYPLIVVNQIILGLIKICFLLLVVSVCFKFSSKKEYAFFIGLFLGLTFLVGGGIIAIFNLFNLDYSAEISIALMGIPAYAILRVVKGAIKGIYKRRDIVSVSFKCELRYKGVLVESMGFIDTGNGVYDNDSPVIFIDLKTATRLFSGGIPSVKTIEVRTATGSKNLPTIVIDRLKIYRGDEPNIYNNVTACVIKSVRTGFGVILHPSLIEGENYETKKSNQKIS